MTGFHSLPSLKRLCTPKASPKKISIQVITLMALSRLTAMETKQSKRKEQQ
jgi:hypothetical protein